MKKALILNTLKDVEYYIQSDLLGQIKDFHIFSTSVTVDVFLKEKYKIECNCLSRYLSNTEVRNIIDRSKLFNGILIQHLDELYSGSICSYLNIRQFDVFNILHAAYTIFDYNIFSILISSIRKVIQKHGIEEIYLYNVRLNSIFENNLTLDNIVKLCDVRVLNITSRENLPINNGRIPLSITSFKNKVIRNSRYPFLMLEGIANIIRNMLGKDGELNDKKPTIMVDELLYGYSFIRKQKDQYNLIPYNKFIDNIKGEINTNNSLDQISSIFRYKETEETFLKVLGQVNDDEKEVNKLVLKDVVEDLSKKIHTYKSTLENLAKFNQKNKISLGFWANPPDRCIKGLIYSFLLSKDIPVIGSQHGGNYFIQDNHAEISDMVRCTHFLSWGLSEAEALKNGQIKDIKPEIIPVGNIRTSKNSRKFRKIDILVPLTFSFPLYLIGIVDERPDVLLDRQIKIFSYLSKIDKYSIMVKPFKDFNEEVFATLPFLRDKKNIRINNNLSYTETLDLYKVKCVVIDGTFSDSAVYESLSYDVEVFALYNEIEKIQPLALSYLEKRIHLSTTIDDLLDKLGKFLQGKLPAKRDNYFYDHYIYKENTKQNVLKLIEDLVK